VLVVGTEAESVCGPDYIATYPKTFPELANKYAALLYPSFMDGVTGFPDLLQPDGNPNSKGEAIIVERILPMVAALIARVESEPNLSNGR
jgi:acyl-CoA thioesterase-1